MSRLSRSPDDFDLAIRAIEEAILTNKLNGREDKQQAMNIVNPGGWRRYLEGVDWIEVAMFADENRMKFLTVEDLMLILRAMKSKQA